MNDTGSELAKELNTFFSEYQKTQSSEIASWLTDFFAAWSDNVFPVREPEKNNAPDMTMNCTHLSRFLDEFSSSMEGISHSLPAFDLWQVAGIADNEVRNTSVLAWLLDPRGSHQLGETFLTRLLKAVDRALPDTGPAFPHTHKQYCRVSTEVCPGGNSENRVDVVLDADNFCLFIEAKIRAREEESQLSRYCTQARHCAGETRPWAIIFLTPDSHFPVSHGEADNLNHIACLSWRYLSALFEPELRRMAHEEKIQPFIQYTISGFLNHIYQF